MTNFNNNNTKSDRVFVTKIPRTFAAEEVQKYFEKFGTVTDFHMPKNPRCVGHKGIAFVSFTDVDVAEQVRENKNHMLQNHRIVVDHATARNFVVSAQRKAETQALLKRGSQGKCQIEEYLEYVFGTDNLSSLNNGYPMDEATCVQWMNGAAANESSQNTGVPAYESNRVFVTKISEDISQENMVEYFTQFGDLEDCYMPGSQSNQEGKTTHKGIAFVSFKDASLAGFVLSRGSYEIKPGQFIVVDKANMRSSNGSRKTGGAAMARRNRVACSNRSSPY